MPITLGTTLSRSDVAVYGAINANEGVLMSVVDGKFYATNAVAGRIWELLETPQTIAELCEAIAAEFSVDRTICEAEVLRFAEDLIGRRILQAR